MEPAGMEKHRRQERQRYRQKRQIGLRPRDGGGRHEAKLFDEWLESTAQR